MTNEVAPHRDGIVMVGSVDGHRDTTGSRYAPTIQPVWILLAAVIVIVVLIVVAGRGADQRSPSIVVDHVDDLGLHVDGSVAGWSTVFEVVAIARRDIAGTWFGFEIRTEHNGTIVVDGTGDPSGEGLDGQGPAERFLSDCHRLPGFDHESVRQTFARRRARAVCYRR